MLCDEKHNQFFCIIIIKSVVWTDPKKILFPKPGQKSEGLIWVRGLIRLVQLFCCFLKGFKKFSTTFANMTQKWIYMKEEKWVLMSLSNLGVLLYLLLLCTASLESRILSSFWRLLDCSWRFNEESWLWYTCFLSKCTDTDRSSLKDT